MTKRPVVVRVANCKSVSAPADAARAIFHRALTEPGHYGHPDVVLAMECGDFDAELEAEYDDWEAIQYGSPGDVARRGSVIAYNPAHVREVRRWPLIETSPAGDGVLTRYTARAKLAACGHRPEPFNAGHAPPDRSEGPQRHWYARVRHIDGILGADFNDRPDFLDARYGRQVVGVRGQVLALLVPKRIAVSKAWGHDIGSDHLAIDAQLFTTKEKP